MQCLGLKGSDVPGLDKAKILIHRERTGARRSIRVPIHFEPSLTCAVQRIQKYTFRVRSCDGFKISNSGL